MSILERIVKSQSAYGVGTPLVLPGGSQDYPRTSPTRELGVTGLLRTRGTGFVFEEWLPQLSVNKQRQVYRQMRDNDAVLGALFFAMEMILRSVDWFVEEARGNSKAVAYARWLEEALEDMSMTFEDLIAEYVTTFVFGFSLFEVVMKRRAGPRAKVASRFDDGLIAWRKLAPRAQESILYWDWDEEGGLTGAVQLAPPEYRTVPIPIERLALFRTTALKNNPEGRSVLRNCFRPWLFKTRDEEVEGIGLERDLCGMPVLYASAEAIEEMGGQAVAERMIRNVRIDNQMGVLLPQAFDEKGNRAVLFELLKTAGGKQMNAGDVIKRHNADMLNSVLAGFIQLGHTETGSKALHMSATQIFAQSLSSFCKGFAAVFNRILVPRAMDMNHMDLALAPKLMPGEIQGRDLQELADYVSKLAVAGITFTDPDTVSVLRKKADLPEAPSSVQVTGTSQLDPEGDDDAPEKLPEAGHQGDPVENPEVKNPEQKAMEMSPKNVDKAAYLYDMLNFVNKTWAGRRRMKVSRI